MEKKLNNFGKHNIYSMKDRLLNLRVPDDFLKEYKEFCELNSISVSKRIRRLMELDLEKWKKYQIEKNRRF